MHWRGVNLPDSWEGLGKRFGAWQRETTAFLRQTFGVNAVDGFYHVSEPTNPVSENSQNAHWVNSTRAQIEYLQKIYDSLKK